VPGGGLATGRGGGRRLTAWESRAFRLVGVGGFLGPVPIRARGGGPAPPPNPSPVEALVQPAKQALAPLPPFLADTDFHLHFRSYYLNRIQPSGTVNEAEAFGGWASYRSGWLLDTFAMGATFYGSAPLYAPEDRDGTLLLQTGQKGYYVPGQAWGPLRYKDYALLKG